MRMATMDLFFRAKYVSATILAPLWMFVLCISCCESKEAKAMEDAIPSNDQVDIPGDWTRWLQHEKLFVSRAASLSKEQVELIQTMTPNSLLPGKRSQVWMTEIERERNSKVSSFPADDALQRFRFERNFAKQLQQILTPDQWSVYQEERRLRDDFSKKRNALGLTLAYDRMVRLSLPQLDQLEQSFFRWNRIATIHSEHYLHQEGIGQPLTLPVADEPFLEEILSPSQMQLVQNSTIRIIVQGDASADVGPLSDSSPLWKDCLVEP